MAGLRSGSLNRRISIQQRSTTNNTFGEQSTTWSTVATVWGEISPLSARELMAAQAVQSEVSHQITVRYQAIFANPKTVAGMRAVYNGRIFNIHGSMNQDERNRVVVLSASEGLNEG